MITIQEIRLWYRQESRAGEPSPRISAVPTGRTSSNIRAKGAHRIHKHLHLELWIGTYLFEPVYSCL